MKWFGEPWPSDSERAPVCEDDARRAPVPVGQECAQCGESIAASARGVLIPTFEDAFHPWHLECLLFSVLGGRMEGE